MFLNLLFGLSEALFGIFALSILAIDHYSLRLDNANLLKTPLS